MCELSWCMHAGGGREGSARAGDALALGAVGLLELLLALEGGEGGDRVGDAARLQALQELGVAQVALGAEAGRAQRQRLLRLCTQRCRHSYQLKLSCYPCPNCDQSASLHQACGMGKALFPSSLAGTPPLKKNAANGHAAVKRMDMQ